MHNLTRFIEAQEHSYPIALAEIRNGRKQSHWMWYIFPQIAGLGLSEISQRYAIRDIEEATAYLQHPVLGARLVEISNVLLRIEHKSAHEIFGSPDDMKLKSCMTLYGKVPGAQPVFKQVLDKYFQGQEDMRTINLLT